MILRIRIKREATAFLPSFLFAEKVQSSHCVTSSHPVGESPYYSQYIAKKHSAGGRGRVRQHPTLCPLPFGEGVRGWGKIK